MSPWSLTSATREEIAAFVARFITYRLCDVDACVARASYVLLYRDERGRIVATTVVRSLRVQAGGREARALLTSMVAVDPSQRRRGLLAKMGAYSYARARLRWKGPLYWAAVAVSPEGFAQMAHNFERFWPREGAEVPAEIDALMLEIAEDFRCPIERDAAGRLLLSSTLRPVASATWRAGAASYFAQVIADRPPGTGVLCVAPLSARSMARVLLRQASRRWARPSSSADQSGWSSMPSQ